MAIPVWVVLHTMRLPAVIVLGFWFLLQLVSNYFSTGGGGGVAWGAHIGGFVAGIVLIPLFKRKGVHLFSQASNQQR